MKALLMAVLVLVVIPLVGCYDQTAYNSALQADETRREAAWAESERLQAEETARREKAWAESDALLEKEREQQLRWDALLTKQEEQARRFDAILDKWEKMAPSKDK